MTAALAPQTAVAYLTALTARTDAVVVAAADGVVLAGDPALADAARAVLPPDGGRAEFAGLHAAADDQHLVAIRTGGVALGSVVQADLAAVLAALRR